MSDARTDQVVPVAVQKHVNDFGQQMVLIERNDIVFEDGDALEAES